MNRRYIYLVVFSLIFLISTQLNFWKWTGSALLAYIFHATFGVRHKFEKGSIKYEIYQTVLVYIPVGFLIAYGAFFCIAYIENSEKTPPFDEQLALNYGPIELQENMLALFNILSKDDTDTTKLEIYQFILQHPIAYPEPQKKSPKFWIDTAKIMTAFSHIMNSGLQGNRANRELAYYGSSVIKQLAFAERKYRSYGYSELVPLVMILNNGDTYIQIMKTAESRLIQAAGTELSEITKLYKQTSANAYYMSQRDALDETWTQANALTRRVGYDRYQILRRLQQDSLLLNSTSDTTYSNLISVMQERVHHFQKDYDENFKIKNRIGDMTYLILNVFGPAHLDSQWKCFGYIDQVRVALALTIYKREHGDFPIALDKLAPAYIDKIPTDTFSEQKITFNYSDGSLSVYLSGLPKNSGWGAFQTNEFKLWVRDAGRGHGG